MNNFIEITNLNSLYKTVEEAVKLKDLKAIIGKAWSGSNGKKASIINVSVGLKTNEWVDILKQQELRLNTLESKLNDVKMLSSKLEKLESKLDEIIPDFPKEMQLNIPTLNLPKLEKNEG